MRITDQYVWNFLFTLFFVALLFIGTIIVKEEARIPIGSLDLLDLTLITLASFRLTRLFVYDHITKFIREQFYDVIPHEFGYTLEKPTKGIKRTLADLSACPWCVGVWVTVFTTFAYLMTSLAMFPIIILALSAVVTFLQLLTNLVGHKAEQAKASIN